jgi:hypothetical protein
MIILATGDDQSVVIPGFGVVKQAMWTIPILAYTYSNDRLSPPSIGCLHIREVDYYVSPGSLTALIISTISILN